MKYDVAIIGSGIVGLVLAIALAKQSRLRIALVEAKPFVPEEHRVSAISQASKIILQKVDCW